MMKKLNFVELGERLGYNHKFQSSLRSLELVSSFLEGLAIVNRESVKPQLDNIRYAFREIEEIYFEYTKHDIDLKEERRRRQKK